MAGNHTIPELETEEYNEIVDYLKEWDTFRFLHLVTLILGHVVGNGLLFGILWYELFGGMDQYKTVLNQLMAHLIFATLLGQILISNGLMVAMSLPSGSMLFCDIVFGASNMMIIYLLLGMTMNHVIRYYLIFILKRIYGYDDNFLAFYISLLILVISAFLTSVDLHFGYHRGTMWFVCAGPLNGAKIQYGPPSKLGAVFYMILLKASAYMIFSGRYTWYKVSLSKSNVPENAAFGQLNPTGKAFLTLMNSRNITDNVVTMLLLPLFVIYAFVLAVTEEKGFYQPFWFKTASGKAFAYAEISLPIILTTMVIPAMIYSRGKTLRQSVQREIQDTLRALGFSFT